MSIDISLVIEKVQDSHDSDLDEEEIDRTKFFSPGDIITKLVWKDTIESILNYM